jgi:anthranilate phosphoribosyltransferase
LGSDVAWLAHGHDGMDEITTTSPTDVVELSRGMIRHFTLEPEQLALPRVPLDRLRGGDAAHNAGELKKLLQGERNPYRDIVLLNASAALIVAGNVKDLKQGMHMAAMALDGGAAQHTLDRLIKVSNHQAV